ncbi:LamG domain-containing protein [Cellulomonas sp. URHE0023]|uniref:LamG domain-containing protein n=1 Tax=Cellulomonas sp. URHE0023 TaxID=1380354 RepID=UPI0004854080|nr:LamG domain-containing protein [Cellulomonas sp. URHE0023]
MSRTSHITRRLVAVVAAAGLIGVGLGTAASADTAPTDPSDPASPTTVSADALPTPQIDGVVWSQTTVGDTVYVAGSFTTARPAGAAAGVDTVPRSNLLAFSISTGQLLPWAPVADGQVRSITRSPDGSRIYVTGDFSKIDGVYHVRIAAFDTATNAIVAGFKPTLAASGLAIAASNTTVYVGGNFKSVASTTGGTLVPRLYLAAFSASTGAMTPFVADTNDAVTALAVTPDGQRVAVGGRFTSLSGSPFYGLGSVDPTTGAPVSFPANNQIRNAGASSGITSLYADESGIYGTGYHFGSGGNDEGPFRIDATTGELIWVADCHGDSYSSFPVGGVVYVVSHEHYCGNMGGFPQTDPWSTYRFTAFSKAATGVNTPDIYGYPDHDGEPSPTLLNFYPDFYTGTYTGQGQAGWSVTGNNDYVVYGGEFPGVNGAPQQGLTRFAVSSKAPNKQGARVSSTDWALSVTSQAIGKVRISYPTNWDRDNETLTYKLYRGADNTTPLQTVTIKTPFWKPQMTFFTDTTAPPGSAQQYRVTATDPFNNVTKSAWVPVTVSSDPLSSYASAVLNDGASSYWRLGEPSGTTMVDDWAGGAYAIAGDGVTRGATGAIGSDPNAASTFSGTTTGLVATQTPVEGPQTFSIEAWFKTTTTAGGKIVGFGNKNTGNSGSYDRHIYMETSGQVTFGVYPGQKRTLTSSKTYNDGSWHHVVGTLGPTGEKLYVDGARIGQRTDTTGAQAIPAGYWRIGGDSAWAGAPYFNGSIDDVAIYPTALTAQKVDAHWVSSGRSSTFPATPADAYGAAVLGQSGEAPEYYWRLGEAVGTTAASAGPWASDGSYVGTVTKNVAGALTGVSNTAVSFSGTSNNFVVAKSSISSPAVYSEELWFKTTTTTGGKLIGFGNRNTGTSTSYDRHVYMENNGRLTFGVRTGGSSTTTITTPSSYNNGQWHHMVATQASEGMRLYVDGVLQASSPQAGAQVYTGYWRVGGDTTWGPQAWFKGSIDEAAVYSTALPAGVVLQHFQIGTNTVPNLVPVAAFTKTVTDLSIHLDGSTSSDPDGTIASYSWAFDDGTTLTGAVVDHAYTTPGDHTVTLTVTDNRGATAMLAATDTFTSPNGPPTAAFSWSNTDLTAQLDAAGSADSDGTIASYTWTFGDGATVTGANASLTHPYTTAGTYPVTLVVTDDDGATSAPVTQDVTVTDPPNVLPTAAFTTVVAADGLTVNVNASGSADPDGTIASYAWTFGPSGTGTGKTSSYTFPADGTYTIGLTVTDNRGGTATTSVPVTVAMPANVPPSAVMSAAVQPDGRTVNVSASGSADPDGSIVSYAWAFGPSGTGTGVTSSYTFPADGTYTIGLTVTDNRGGTATSSTSITVAAPTGPPIFATDTFSRTSASGWGAADFGGTWALTGSASLFTVQGGVGRLSVAAGSTPRARLPIVQQDVDATASVTLDHLSDTGVARSFVAVRSVASTTDYYLNIKYAVTGGVSLQLQRRVAGVETTLGSATAAQTGATVAGGQKLNVRVQAQGVSPTTVRARVWIAGQPEPTTWQVTGTDSAPELQVPAGIGIGGYTPSSTGNGAIVFSWDDVSARGIA